MDSHSWRNRMYTCGFFFYGDWGMVYFVKREFVGMLYIPLVFSAEETFLVCLAISFAARCCVSVKIGRELQCFLANGDMGRSCILLFRLQSHAVDSLNSYGRFSAYASCYISIYCIGAERHIELFSLKRLTFSLCSYKEPLLPFLGGSKIAYFSNPIPQHIPA